MKSENIKPLVNLNEHAYNRATFLDKIENKSFQLVCKCILVIQAKYYSNDLIFKQNKNHWKVELRSICLDMMRKKLKVKNTFENRYQLIEMALIQNEEILSPDILKSAVLELDKKENTSIRISNKFFNQLKDVVYNLMELIARGDISSVNAYISKL